MKKNRLRNTNEKDDAGYFLKVSKKNLTKKHFFNNFTGMLRNCETYLMSPSGESK